MATETTTSLTWKEIRRRIINTMEHRNLPKTKAHVELGVSRSTLYSWCGEHSSVPPAPNHARVIAKFIEADPFEVREALLRANGYLDADEYIEVTNRNKAATLRRRSSNGAIPGYVSSGEHHRLVVPIVLMADAA